MNRAPTRSWLSAVLVLGTVFGSVGPRAPAQDVGEARDPGPSDLLPTDVVYDPAIPTPASVLGFEVGTQHARHDQIVRYFEVLAEHSDRMHLEDYGRTHEGRRLLLATVSSPRNLGRLEQIRRDQVRAARDGEFDGDLADRPVIVWQGYSVHGNEASGANAALLFAYHLCAATGAGFEQLLDRAVVLLDPCINPDGYSRFAEWATAHHGRIPIAPAVHREHQESWPGGRTNHYWFDLNRDWLLLVQPESRARLVQYHRWKPNLLTDFHEMGTQGSYFFQPGIPSRQNPWTPVQNLELTRRIAEFHAAALDRIGSAYYTEESFDDFYYGKGSTYPDAQGSVGILFEQAGTRGMLQENGFGPLSFAFTVRNQLRTSISSLEAAVSLREPLLEHQLRCAREHREHGADDPVGAVLLGERFDPRRLAELTDVLLRHGIEVYDLAERVEREGTVFEPGRALLVPSAQVQYPLLRSLFEERKDFADHAFYDVSTWNLAHAYALDHVELPREDTARLRGAAILEASSPPGRFADLPDAAGYALCWDSADAPRALARLLEAQVRVRVATRPFSTAETSFPRGTLVVLPGSQELEPKSLRTLLRRAADEDGVDVTALASGLTPRGVDLGSPSVVEVPRVKPALVVGGQVSAYEAGEIWFELDQRFQQPLVLVDEANLSALDWSAITHLVLVSGASSHFSGATLERLRQWLREGGTVIATRGSAAFARKELAGISAPERKSDSGEAADLPDRPGYSQFPAQQAEQRIAGTIFEAWIDESHPLAFGLHRDRISLFRTSTATLAPDREEPTADLAQYTAEPHVCGYASEENVTAIARSVAVAAHRVGRGLVVQFADDPCFRGTWRGGSRLLANALYFSSAVQSTRNRGGDGTASGDDAH